MPYLLRLLSAAATVLFAMLAQAQFTDDFSDGNFTENPVWGGDSEKFIVENGQLRSNAGQLTVAGNYYLSTPSMQMEGQWEFFFNLKFSPSGANYVDVYLTSDVQDLTAPGNGYFVRIGETAKHVVLNKKVGGTISTLVASADNVVNSSTNNPFRIKVIRAAGDVWTFFHDDGNTGTYALVGTATDASVTTGGWFGIRITQSTAASPANNHFFDDFYVGPIILDTTPPSIVSVTVVSNQNVDLLFNEPVNQASAEDASHYDVLPFNSVANASLDGTNPALVHLSLAFPMQNLGTCTLLVNGVEDLAGNAITGGQTQFTYVEVSAPQPGEVVINEIMPDPTPVVQLPDAEYVELFNNTTDRVFDLAGWTFSTLSTQTTLPAYHLLPGEYVVFVNNGKVAEFTGIAPVQGWSLSTTALLNAGTTLTLKSPGGTVIDQVTYSDTWYQDPVKKDGGWSLERKDPFTPCSGAGNWAASTDMRGGTPGAANSVFELLVDNEPPALLMAYVMDEATVDLLFNEMMDGASLMNGTYTFEPALGIDSRELVAPERIRLHLNGTLIEGQLYTVTVSGVSDCPGNAIGAQNTVLFALPELLAKGDVVINEVLYDPRGSGSDFVELYNRSQKVVSLQGLQLANVTNGTVANARTITSEPFLLLPGGYVAIASDVANVLMNYPLGHADRMLQMALPNYNNGSGTVVFLGQAGDTLDWFAYSDALHFPLLKSVDGVSLERVDPNRPTDDPTNWHSAAAEVNFATPGYQNSQYAPAPAPRGSITIDPAIFSPDNDGHQDLLTITYEFDEPGFVGTMKVFDLAGREVQTLMNNALLGTSGSISWDGMMDTNELARMGPYVIYMEAYDLAGNVEKFRKTVVLAHRL
ncbi:MAG TPA: lamin tail domain-containing protein [Flavobacteriales bacterium]|nr:lamin tail domain-containing protein [Flavobacteriales bacterium]